MSTAHRTGWMPYLLAATLLAAPSPPAAAQAPQGWIQDGAWLYLGPLGNGNGCAPGNAMLSNWIAPLDIAALAPQAGDDAEIDFDQAASTGWRGVGDAPVWVSLAEEGFLGNDLVDLVNVTNTIGANAGETLPVVDVLAVLVTYVEYTGSSPLPVWLCDSSDDSVQIWVNNSRAQNVSACRVSTGNCTDRAPAILLPGVNTIKALVWQGGNGWSVRLRIQRAGGTLVTDSDPEITIGPDMPDPLELSNAIITRQAAASSFAACAQPGDVAVTLTGNVGGAETVTLSETVVGGPFEISDITGGGVFTPAEPPERTPVGLFDDARDVGAPCYVGETVDNGDGSYELTGGGIDVWVEGDEFQFAYREATGDFTMTARIAQRNFAPGSRWGKAGLMAREDLTRYSRYCLLESQGEDPQDADRLAGRATYGGTDCFELTALAGFEHHDWLRLSRSGNLFTGEMSDDGTSWIPVAERSYASSLPQTLLLGLMVCSHTDVQAGCVPSSAVFDAIDITGGDDPKKPAPAGGTITWENVSRDELLAGMGYTLRGDGIAILHGDDGEHATAGVQTVALTPTGPVGIFSAAHDIGGPCVPGSSVYDSGNDTYTITGSGVDIWVNGDQFQFAYLPQEGDFSLVAHVREARWASGSRWGKAGIMARQDCTASARYAMMQVQGEDPVDTDRFAGRPVHGATGDGANFETIPPGGDFQHWDWIRLDRIQNALVGYFSDDGSNWLQVHSMDWGDSAPPEVLLGLAVCSHTADNGCTPATIVFDNVELSFPEFSLTRTAGPGACELESESQVVQLQGEGDPGSNVLVREEIRTPLDVTAITGGGVFEPFEDPPPNPVGEFTDARDIGNPCVAGSTVDNGGGSYTVTGGGRDIWTGGDEFQFAYRLATGDFDMVAHIAERNWAPASQWGKAGIMVRENSSPRSRYQMVQDIGEGLEQQSRIAGRGTHEGSNNFESMPLAQFEHRDWMRLTREGNIFTAYMSEDGATWNAYSTMDWGPDAPQTVMLGLAVCSHTADGGCTKSSITFDEVSIDGGGGPHDPLTPLGGTITWDAPRSALEAGVSYTLRGRGMAALSGTADETVIGGRTAVTATSVQTEDLGIFEAAHDIGMPCGRGETIYNSANDSYAVTGAGMDIWTGGDEFQFVRKHVDGDFDMIAHVQERNWAPGSRWGKVGIMARQDCTTTSRYAMIQTQGEDPLDADRFAGRPTHGGADNFETTPLADFEHRDWMRLVREGNAFSAYMSEDGNDWQQFTVMDWGAGAPSDVLLGLAVCSHAETTGGCAPATIVFDNVEILTGESEPLFHRGDPNDDGDLNITDGIFVLNFLFLGGPAPACLEAANANDDGDINITDGIYLLNYLFLGGPAPAAPGPPAEPCGPDPADSPTSLGCESYTNC